MALLLAGCIECLERHEIEMTDQLPPDTTAVRSASIFLCSACGGEFEYESDEVWSQEDALNESLNLHGPIPDSELAVVCDDCFLKMKGLGYFGEDTHD